MTAFVLATALGCLGSDESGAEDSYTAETPLPYEPNLDESMAEPSLDGLAEAIARSAEVAYGFHADPIIDAYDLLRSTGDDYCPQLYEKENGSVWYSGCTATNGNSFSGFGYELIFDGKDSGGTLYYGGQIYGQMTMTDASGQIFRGDGTAMSLLGYASGGGNIYYSSVTGAFQWTAAPVTSWLHEGDSTGITVYAQDYPMYDVRLVQIQGSVQVEEKTGLFAVAFDPIGTLYESDGLGAACTSEPGGTLSVRDPNAIWYDVAFDGPTSDGFPGDASRCDGCGDVSVEGEVIGSICPDFSTWMSWESSPW
jgi:hypothetical protein